MQVDAGREWRGGQNQVRLLCRELAREPTLSVVLVTRRESELARRAARAGTTVRGVAWQWSWDPRAVVALAGLLKRFQPDILHVHDAHALSVARAATALVSSPRGRRRAIVATRRVDFRLRRPGRWSACDRIIAVSDAVRRVLVHDGVPAERIVVIPDGIDPDEVHAAARSAPAIRQRLGIPAGVPLAVNLAALVDHKDHATLIRAAAAARTARPDLHWVIAGDGPRRGELQRAIDAQDLSATVQLVGHIEEADALISEASVLVMSSREEGLGSVVLHGLALGKPVVATRAGGLPEIVPARWLVDVGDAAALGERVVQALDQPVPTTLPERHTASAMAAAVVATYRALI